MATIVFTVIDEDNKRQCMFVSSDLPLDNFKREIKKQMSWVDWDQMEVWYANGDYNMKVIMENYWALCVQALRLPDPRLTFQIRRKPAVEVKLEAALEKIFNE